MLNWGTDKTPITYSRRERPTLLERIHDLPEDGARWMTSGVASRGLRLAAVVALGAAIILGFTTAGWLGL